MPEDTNEIQNEIEKLEVLMQAPEFWNDKARAQAVVRRIAELKDKKEGLGRYDKGNAILTITSGAGGDDSEDFARMLFEMYNKYATKKGWDISLIHENKSGHNGYRNISVEIVGKGFYKKNGSKASVLGSKIGPYGVLKNESGVH